MHIVAKTNQERKKVSTNITAFVKSEVYPNIDIRDSGLLDEFHPKKAGDAFILDCPFCGVKNKAYHYPGSGYVTCNRENNCGESGSFWDILMMQGATKSEALKELAEFAGVSLPDDENKSQRTVVEAVKKALKNGLSKSSRAKDYMSDIRGWDEEEVSSAPFGYIHEVEYFYNSLVTLGVSKEVLELWGIEKMLQTASDPALFEYSFNQRIVGWWEQEDGSLKFWGRDVTGKREMKYRYQEGLKKTVPCYWSEPINREGRENLIFVEGPIDAARLMVNGLASVAIGGASVSSGMAEFVAPRLGGYTHWIDNDIAGKKGGISTIMQTAQYGIYSVIVCIEEEDTKDADEMIGAMPLVKVMETVERASVGCGKFLAGQYILAREELSNATPAERNAVFEKAKGYYKKLNGLAKMEFFKALEQEGVLLQRPDSEAVMAYANLLDSDVLPHMAERIVKERFGYIVKLYGYE